MQPQRTVSHTMKKRFNIAPMNDRMSAAEASAQFEARLSQLLCKVAQEQDRQAFAELFDAMAPRLKSRLMKSGLDAANAEDLLQDVMVSVWTKAGLFDPDRGSAFAWVFTIARNAKIDRMRRSRPTASLDIMEWDPIDDSESSEDRLIKADRVSGLEKALKSISPEQRIILEMAFVEELPQSDIARKLGLPLGTVKSRMRLAYSHLRKSLELST